MFGSYLLIMWLKILSLADCLSCEAISCRITNTHIHTQHTRVHCAVYCSSSSSSSSSSAPLSSGPQRRLRLFSRSFYCFVCYQLLDITDLETGNSRLHSGQVTWIRFLFPLRLKLWNRALSFISRPNCLLYDTHNHEMLPLFYINHCAVASVMLTAISRCMAWPASEEVMMAKFSVDFT